MPADPRPLPGVNFDNTPPASKALAGVAFDDTPPGTAPVPFDALCLTVAAQPNTLVPGAVVDGVVLSVGDRVFKQNAFSTVYVVQSAGAAIIDASWGGWNVQPYIRINSGAANAGKIFRVNAGGNIASTDVTGTVFLPLGASAFSNSPPGVANLPGSNFNNGASDPVPLALEVLVAANMDNGDMIPGEVIDGVSVRTGDRVLRFGSGSGDDGVFVVDVPGNPAYRAPEASMDELLSRPYVKVLQGTALKGKVFRANLDPPDYFEFVEVTPTPNVLASASFNKTPPQTKAL